MTEADLADGDVTVTDAVAWLQEEGLARLAALAGSSGPAAAFTVEVASGTVTMFPANSGGVGGDSVSRSADDLPAPADSPGRLVTVGITTGEALLVIDLAGPLMVAVNGDRPELAVRSWVCQLLLNPAVMLTTNSSDVAPGSAPRCKKSFIPGGGGTIVSVDDGNPPVTTIAMNSVTDSPDYLDIASDGSGEMYLGPRFWQLSQVLTIADAPWSVLAATLSETGR